MNPFNFVCLLTLPVLVFSTPNYNNGFPQGLLNQGKIVGGVEATPNEFPFIVDMHLGTRYCSGTLISPDWIVTSAHCIYLQPSPWGYIITAGDHNLHSIEGTEQYRAVTKVIIHENYAIGGSGRENDIALIMVDQPFVFNRYVEAVTLPGNNFIPAANATVAGWGLLNEEGISPSVLMKVTVPHVAHASCNNSYMSHPTAPIEVGNTTVCYGEDGKGFCQEDSGSPLVGGDNNTLIGIASWGYGCGRAGYPGVYTEVSKFVDWIQLHSMYYAEDESPLAQVTSCVGHINATSGRITLTNISPGQNCLWVVASQRDVTRVILTESSLLEDDVLSILHEEVITEVGRNYTVRDTDFFYITLVASPNSSNTPRSFTLELYGSRFSNSYGFTGSAALTDPTGSFSYPTLGGNYGNNEEALFLILPEGGNSSTITFTSFRLQGTYDNLSVMSLQNNEFDFLAVLTGTTIPPPITINGIGYLMFYSDSSVTDTGFSFRYE